MRYLRRIGYALGLIWSLPHSVVGLLLALVYWPRAVRWSDGCLEFVATRIIGFGPGDQGAQTHGLVVWHTDREMWDSRPLRVHERVHALQGLIGGPCYVASYALHWLWLFVSNGGPGYGPRWYRAYRGVWAEQQAYRIEAEYRRGERPGAWGGG